MIPTSDIEITQNYYGREGQLDKLRAQTKDFNLSYKRRRKAYETMMEIITQCEDKQLMALRSRLMKASIAGDVEWVGRLSAQMKLYSGEEPETGLPE